MNSVTSPQKLAVSVALLVWAASLLLPVAPVEGPLPTGMASVAQQLFISTFGPLYIESVFVTPQIVLCSWLGLLGYFAVPVSVFVAIFSLRIAGMSSAYGGLVPIGLLAFGALHFNVLQPYKFSDVPGFVLASGLICWIVSAVMLTIVWTVAPSPRKQVLKP